jgi:hypothetical protein
VLAVSTFRLLMDGGPHHGRIIEHRSGAEWPPLIWQFAVMPEIPTVAALVAGEVSFAPIEAGNYQRAVPAQGDASLWFYDYLGRF